MGLNLVHQLYQLKGHKSAIYSLTAGLRQGGLLSAGSDGLIVKWSPDKSDQGEIMGSTGERIFNLISFPEAGIIFCGTMSGDLFQLKYHAENQVKRFRFHQGSIYRMEKWDQLMVVAAGDGIISLWNYESAAIENHLKISHSKLRSLSIDSRNSVLYTGDSEGHIWKLRLPGLELVNKTLSRHQKTVFSLKYIDESNLLISGGLDAHLQISDQQDRLLQDIKAHWFCINDICDLTGTNYLATASRDKSIRIWDKRDWSLAKEISTAKFAAHRHSVNSLLWNMNDQILFSAGDDGHIFGWKLEMNNDT